MSTRILDALFRRRTVEPAIPLCPDHKIQMQLRGKMGRPTRFSDMTQESYTLLYFCPIEGCDHTQAVDQSRAQIAVQGKAPARPSFSRRGH